jgi:hypothetical protein
MSRAPWVAVGALVACGDNLAPETADPRSGSRLELQYFEYEDGTRQLADRGFFDAARDEPCRSLQWSDGFTYCTPDAHPAIYTNADCTLELGRVPVDRAAASYFLHTFHVGGDFMPSRLYRRGAAAPPPAGAYQLRDDGCTGPVELPASDVFFELGEEVSKAELVELVTRELVIDPRLALRTETSADGMRIPVAIRDRELDVDCIVERPNAPTVDCAPVRATEAVYYHDAACTEPELSAPARPGIASHASDGCAVYHAVGTQVGATPLFRKTPTCTATSAPSGEQLFLLGDPLALATIERLRADTGRRLQSISIAGVADDHVFDRELGSDCRPIEIAGTLRCVPHHALAHPVFADELCLVPVLVALVATRSCEPAVTYASQLVDGRPELHAIGAASGTVYEVSTGDRCLPYEPPAGFAVHEVGPAIPLESFAAATLVADPYE